ncbi:MAG: hypothetical protein D8M58_07540 [Calditrichaeota bacterium]|nr:MAG: hypothetical protein DWQ03_18950 [Calditrichota bacterium]MBL1205234.1 hypothetical protein [Calditrichota bacterium]NOG45063.1 hypothetical protein [Calditrichota bacterium]
MLRIILLLLSTMPFSIFAQSSVHSDRLTMPSQIRIKLDGVINEKFWNSAEKFSDFRQLSPGIDIPATEKTQAFIAYDNEYLYIAVDMDAKEVFGSVVERDTRFFLMIMFPYILIPTMINPTLWFFQ